MDKRLEGVDLNLLLTLHWLLAERNVTAAAAKLGLSQPAASRALSRLRDVFGDPLLVKVGGEMAPTPLAEKLQPQLSHVIEQCRDVLRVSGPFVPGEQSGRFRIACSDYVGVLAAAVWQEIVSSDAPAMELDLVTPTLETARELVTGQVDICIIPDNVAIKLPSTIDRDAFVMRPILDQEFVSAVRIDHPLAGTKIGIEEYLALDHVLITPEGSARGMVDTALAKIGRERRIKYRAQSFLMGVPLVRYTDCVITGPRPLLQTRAESLYLFEPPIAVAPTTLCAVWHPNWTQDPRHRWVRDRLFEALAGFPDCPLSAAVFSKRK